MVKPPFVYLAGLLRADRHAEQGRAVGLAARPDGPGAVQPAERERVGGRRGVAVDQRDRGRGSTPRRPCSRTGSPRARSPGRDARGGDRPRRGGHRAAAVGAGHRAVLRRYARSAVAGRTEKWEVNHYYPERQRVLRHLLLAGPRGPGLLRGPPGEEPQPRLPRPPRHPPRLHGPRRRGRPCAGRRPRRPGRVRALRRPDAARPARAGGGPLGRRLGRGGAHDPRAARGRRRPGPVGAATRPSSCRSTSTAATTA